MGKRGPRPEPAALQLVKGNPSQHKPRPEPKVRLGAPAAPTWLSADGRAEWRRIAPELARLGLLAFLDRGIFAAYCEAWSQFKAATEAIDQAGLVYTAPSGHRRPSPEVDIRDKAMQRLKQLAGELGLSAAARVGIVAEPWKPERIRKGKGQSPAPSARFFS